ncbi:MAG: NAD(P)H-dependent oxidoreductase [Rhodococcus sp. (in: high G+C Gram-positive bacteria)]|uniref:NADPH-dependent FMN reductase n=1 Tax=Rhodococcus sp. BS-15 TaxID=1304954 RepID=UPI000FFCBB85|nr:NAD(P)H-dependent oxidoreductase [Rhodococcus sp. BS-15]
MTSIGIIIGSTRPGRKSSSVAEWVRMQAAGCSDAHFELIDLADFDLPHLDEPAAAAMSRDYRGQHTIRWSSAIDRYDGYIFVTPEYNHGPTGVLKNAIDYLYYEWRDKAVGFVGYGTSGGTRAVEQLRLVTAELHMASVRDQVALSLFDDFDSEGNIAPRDHHRQTLSRMVDQVVAWSQALAPLRGM